MGGIAQLLSNGLPPGAIPAPAKYGPGAYLIRRIRNGRTFYELHGIAPESGSNDLVQRGPAPPVVPIPNYDPNEPSIIDMRNAPSSREVSVFSGLFPNAQSDQLPLEDVPSPGQPNQTPQLSPRLQSEENWGVQRHYPVPPIFQSQGFAPTTTDPYAVQFPPQDVRAIPYPNNQGKGRYQMGTNSPSLTPDVHSSIAFGDTPGSAGESGNIAKPELRADPEAAAFFNRDRSKDPDAQQAAPLPGFIQHPKYPNIQINPSTGNYYTSSGIKGHEPIVNGRDTEGTLLQPSIGLNAPPSPSQSRSFSSASTSPFNGASSNQQQGPSPVAGYIQHPKYPNIWISPDGNYTTTNGIQGHEPIVNGRDTEGTQLFGESINSPTPNK